MLAGKVRPLLGTEAFDGHVFINALVKACIHGSIYGHSL